MNISNINVNKYSISRMFDAEKYVSSIKPFYREELSHNFASYLSRIGIPINNGNHILKDDIVQ